MSIIDKFRTPSVIRSLKNAFPDKVLGDTIFTCDIDVSLAKMYMTYKGQEFQHTTDVTLKHHPVTRLRMRPQDAIYDAVTYFKECIKDVDSMEAKPSPVEEETAVDEVEETEVYEKPLTPQQRAAITRKANAKK